MHSVIPVISADSETLASLLLTVQAGEEISYQTLSDSIRRDVTAVARGNLMTARRKIMREEGVLFEPIRGVGLKRLLDSEIVDLGRGTLQKINRASHRGIQKLSCVQKFEDLTPAEKTKHNAAMSLFGVFYQVSKSKSIKKIESTVAIMQSSLPLDSTLRAFLT